MKVKDIIKQAESYNAVHYYGDGTALYDIGISNKAYSIRVKIEDFNRLRTPNEPTN